MTGNPVELSGTAARGAAATLIGQWIKFVVQSTALIVLARLLTPDDFGIYAMVVAIVGIAFLLGDFGLSMASIQAESVSHEQRSNLFWINIGIGLACGGILFALAGPIADFYAEPEVLPVVRVLGAVFLLQAAGAQFSANASRHFRFRLLAGIDISAQAAALAVAVIVAVAGYGYWALVAQQVTVGAVTLVALLATTRWWPGRPRRSVPLRSFMAFGSHTMGVQALNYLSSNVDSIVLGRSAGPAELGVYDRAYQVFKMPLQQLAAPMTRVALPVLSRLTDPEQFNRYVQRAQVVLAYALGGAFAIAVAVSGPLLALVLGPGWPDAPMLFSILAVGGFFQAMGYVYYWIFLAKGRTALQLQFSVVSRALMIALILLGVNWGAAGVAFAVSAGLAANWLLLTAFAVPRTGVAVAPLVRIAVAPVVLYSAVVATAWTVDAAIGSSLGVFPLLVALLAVCIAVLGIGWLLVPKIRADVRTLVSTVRKVRSAA